MLPSTRARNAIHRSALPCSFLPHTSRPLRCRTVSPQRNKTAKKTQFETAALPEAALFADATLSAAATQSTIASSSSSLPPLASFETAVYAVSCYLDSMIQQSLAGKREEEAENEAKSSLSCFENRELVAAKKKHSKIKNQNSQLVQARPRPRSRSSAPPASRRPCPRARCPCSP